MDQKSLSSAGNVTLEYMKALTSFVRQGALAVIALFSALFFGAYTLGFKITEMLVPEKHYSDFLKVNFNIGLQIAFYSLYAIGGLVRYLFDMNLQVLSQFKDVAGRLDRKDRRSRAKISGPPIN